MKRKLSILAITTLLCLNTASIFVYANQVSTNNWDDIEDPVFKEAHEMANGREVFTYIDENGQEVFVDLTPVSEKSTEATPIDDKSSSKTTYSDSSATQPIDKITAQCRVYDSSDSLIGS